MNTITEHLTCGAPELDLHLNDGGPFRGELVVYMSPTMSGKSWMLVKAGVESICKGLNVLHITLENSTHYVIERYRKLIGQSLSGKLEIKQWAGGEISANTIKQYISHLEWCPDVVIVDCLELMQSTNAYDNSNDLNRLQAVACQLRMLALTHNTLVITATQTNRERNLESVAESYSKLMPCDYVISISKISYNWFIKLLKWFGFEFGSHFDLGLNIVKNRNGSTNVACMVRLW